MTPGYRDDAPLRPGDRVGVFTVDVCTFADERSIAYRAEGPAGPVELRLYSLSHADQMAGGRFEREGLFLSRTLTVLAHPTVRRIHAAGYHANDVWTASDPPAGAALPRWCAEAPRPWHVIASMFHEVAAALAASGSRVGDWAAVGAGRAPPQVGRAASRRPPRSRARSERVITADLLPAADVCPARPSSRPSRRRSSRSSGSSVATSSRTAPGGVGGDRRHQGSRCVAMSRIGTKKRHASGIGPP